MHKALGKQGKKNVATAHSFKKECPVRKGYISEIYLLLFFLQISLLLTGWDPLSNTREVKRNSLTRGWVAPLVYSPHLSFFDRQDEEVHSRKHLSSRLNTTNIVTLNLSLKKCVCVGGGGYKSNIGSFQKLFIWMYLFGCARSKLQSCSMRTHSCSL